MPKDFQQVMDTIIGSAPFIKCYIEDILIGSKGSLKECKDIVNHVIQLRQTEIRSKTVTTPVFQNNGLARFQNYQLRNFSMEDKTSFKKTYQLLEKSKNSDHSLGRSTCL